MRSLVAIAASLVFLTFAQPASAQSRNAAEGYLSSCGCGRNRARDDLTIQMFEINSGWGPHPTSFLLAPPTPSSSDEQDHEPQSKWGPTGVPPLLFAQQRGRRQADKGGDSKW